jgi:GNAT superfamily N-acetyltransferase
MFIAELFLDEISDELRRSYLDRAGKVVDRRMGHMASVRDRLNKGYEIYHADRPAGSSQIVDRFDADTPALARQYYERFIQGYESDVDFDLRLRRSTGIIEYKEPKIQQANRNGIDLSFEKVKDDEYVDDNDDENTVAYVKATSNGKELGHVLFSIDGDTLLPQDLEVDERYRGQGIAKTMYDYVKSLGYQIRRSGQQTDAGAGFWGKHRPAQNVWETELDEITTVGTQSKSKRAHLDVLPNDGRPIPPGEEAEHLGNLVADIGNGLELWSWASRGTVTYYVFDTATRTSQLGTTGRPYKTNRDSFVIQGVYSGPKNQYRAADLYAFLILNQGLTLVSDNKQSEGGYRVWQELEKRYGKTINVHGFDTKTDQGVNVTTRDEPDTHVDRATVKRAGPQGKKELATISRDLRFVASAR